MIDELSDTIRHIKGTDSVKESNKPPKMLVGTDEFYDLVVNSDVFVDKSLMNNELLEDNNNVSN